MNAMTEAGLLEPRQLRRVLGRFFTGVTVITTVDESGMPKGVTANSFTSVSLDPPLILWNQAISSDSHQAFLNAEHFAIHILADNQITLCQRFAKSGPDKFDGVAITNGLGGVPLLEGCCAVLECSRFATHPGGDHVVFIGKVERLSCNDRSPLLFGDGQYMTARPYEATG